MGKHQRTKGATGEREFCALLREYGFNEAERVLGQARDGGGDVVIPPMLYEVKRRQSAPGVRKYLDQAAASVVNYERVEVPCVAIREDGNTEWIVVLGARDFLKMLHALRMLKLME